MNNYIKEKINNVIIVLTIIIMFLALGIALDEGIKKSEINECNNWAEMADKYKGFYLTQNQAEQCNFLNVEINAPIK